METWCRIYNGGDLEDVVRDCTECDVFKNFTENLQDDIPFSVTPDYKPCAFSSSKSQGSHKFMIANTKQEPAGSENMATIESPSSASLDLKSPTRDNNSTQLVERCSPATKTDSNGNNSTKLPARAKRRKSEERRVMRVPMAEGSWNKQGGAGVPSDLWSWRKYGQKPIKGSPYPRGYYRCSSSKGCPARKHIERSRTDPTMLLITYSADHNHVWNWSSHRHARSSRQNSLLDKTVQAWSVPKSTADAPNDDGVSPHMTDKCEPSSHFQDNSLDAENQYSGVDVFGANHILDDNYYFADLGELPELYPKDSIRYSGEEDVNSMFDPFNLFDWSSSANQTCSIHDLNYPTCY